MESVYYKESKVYYAVYVGLSGAIFCEKSHFAKSAKAFKKSLPKNNFAVIFQVKEKDFSMAIKDDFVKSYIKSLRCKFKATSPYGGI